ncbi:hypothetical protein PGT21_016596 [Puccinia graminis f. sp. tritici]|uniref:Uncharacterized protein n=1 Tax=Puccinia graminis f. sp. tritici TaxID=56615 RepID=A0A5B0QTA3_PUCGR|nr:hypothetical protein PGT21_016596 [Puccinia graminis f. sp. tritici]
MVVGKLRMKNTEDNQQPSQIYKQRKRRQRTRSPSIDPPPEPYGPGDVKDEYPSGSSSGSRAMQADKGKARHQAGDEDFQQKLRETLDADNEDLRLESLLEDELVLPRRWNDHQSRAHARSDLNGHQLARLEPAEYEEYIRKRMWSQSNQKHYLYLKDQEEQKRKAREEAHEARKKHRADAKLRAEREALKQTNQKLKSRQRSRDSYTRRRELLNCLLNSDGSSKAEETQEGEQRGPSDARQKLKEESRQVVEFEEIPWPLYPCTQSEEDTLPEIERFNVHSIKDFLVGHLLSSNDPSTTAERKKIIRNAVRSYHPDRFERLVLRVKDLNHAPQKAKEWGLRVSQVLNELNQSID